MAKQHLQYDARQSQAMKPLNRRFKSRTRFESRPAGMWSLTVPAAGAKGVVDSHAGSAALGASAKLWTVALQGVFDSRYGTVLVAVSLPLNSSRGP